MHSIWTQSTQLPCFDALEQDIKTDVLVIGGGIAGLLCAYMLHHAGVDCSLVEARRICGGITKDTTAKITVQHGLIYQKLLREFGLEKAQMYLQANQTALEKYRRLSKTIPCDFRERGSAVYSPDNPKKIEKELEAFTARNYNRQEHSWDCPCHGSRFTKGGRLIDNPATGDRNNSQ